MAKKMTGSEEIQLCVAVENESSCALYLKFGFKIVWEEKHALKLNSGYVDAYHMVLEL